MFCKILFLLDGNDELLVMLGDVFFPAGKVFSFGRGWQGMEMT